MRMRVKRQRGATWALIGLLPEASPGLSALCVLLVLADVALTVGSMLAIGLLIGRVATVTTSPGGHGAIGHGVTGHPDGALMAAFWVFAAIYLAGVTVTPVLDMAASALGRRVNAATARMIVHGALRPTGVAHLSDPDTADNFMLAQGQGAGNFPPSRAVTSLATLAVSRLTGISAAVLLVGFHWWAPLPLMLAWILTGVWRDREIRLAADAQRGSTGRLRKAGYLRTLALGNAAAKEIRVFGLTGWLVEQFTGAWLAGMGGLGQRRDPRRAAAGFAVLAAAHIAVLWPLAVQSADGQVSIARLAVFLQAITGIAALGWIGDLQWIINRASASVPPARSIARLPGPPPAPASPVPASADSRKAVPARPRPTEGIRFEQVGFRYPHASQPVLDGLDLWLPAGGSLALVGDNGAGKSTIIRLLTRLYDPASGRITMDGTDLCDLDAEDWRRQLAVVFQDFGRYELPARDNVGFGHHEAPRDDAALAGAASQAGLGEVIAGLPDGWDTPLSRRFSSGSDLSGGQWQRVALARALFAVEHGARVLVLDEPTAHLDVRAEADLYERFLELTSGLTTILVSHRFGTVRLADRICVLDGGRIVEQGSHAQLVAAGGRYAASFELHTAALTGEHRG